MAVVLYKNVVLVDEVMELNDGREVVLVAKCVGLDHSSWSSEVEEVESSKIDSK